MRFFIRLAILFYVVIIYIGCGFALLFVSQVMPWEDVQYVFSMAYSDIQIRTVIGLTSGILILLSFMFARIILGRQQRERTIAFDNPSGRVSISLSAMEDLIRRMVGKSPEVKEVRPDIVANKKGLDVDIRMILKADANIPELTSRLQEMTKRKILDTVGIEGTVTVRVHVVKIITEKIKDRGDHPKDSESESSGPQIPYSGYR